MIYFDSAATTFQKPAAVRAAMQEALLTMSSPGRGSYPAAVRAADTAFICRSELAEFFHLDSPEQVIFTMNATHALNIAIKSIVPIGGHVVISGYEHNAVTRPLQALHAECAVAEAPLFYPEKVVAAFSALITPKTDAVICNHISNVFGFIQPIEEIASLCRSRGIPLIIDASQSAGVLPLDMRALGAAFIAMPGHKGLYGPQGIGVLLCGDPERTVPIMEGGTGSFSVQQEMPDFLPDRLEAGTHNMPGIAGVLAGLRYVRKRGQSNILRYEQNLAHLMAEKLEKTDNVEVFYLSNPKVQAGVVSVVPKGMDVETLGAKLGKNGIAVRAGLHCAPLAHRSAGTLQTGTIRFSFSDFNTLEEVQYALNVFKRCMR